MTPLNVHWFDGRSTRARPAQALLQASPQGPVLWLRPEGGAPFAVPRKDVQWPERWSARRTPETLSIDLGPHGSLQVHDPAAWQAALAAAGGRPTLAEKMQTRWPALLGMLLLVGAGLWTFYHHGTPWAARHLARAVPLAWERQVTRQVLDQLDGGYLKPSKIPPARQADLQAQFARLAAAVQQDAALHHYSGYAPPLELRFRSGMPPNAFAMPGGAIVMTDAMVELAGSTPGAGDEALMGVLAHEIGHVQHRHGTRSVLEQSVIGLGLGFALGDLPTVTASATTLLAATSYSRSHEREADCYAQRLLHALHMPAAPLGTLLLAAEKWNDKPPAPAPSRKAGQPPKPENQPERRKPADSPAPGGDNWFSTHPDTHDRARRLQNGTACDMD